MIGECFLYALGTICTVQKPNTLEGRKTSGDATISTHTASPEPYTQPVAIYTQWKIWSEKLRFYSRLDPFNHRVDAVFFDKMSAEWRAEQDRCLREIERHQEADKSYMDEGVQILELARNAQRLFERQEPRQKRRLLNFVLSNCTWDDGEVVATFRQPFDLLAETTAIAAMSNAENSANFSKSEIWLPFLNTYRTMCLAPKPEFRRVLEEIRELRLAA